MATTFVVKVKQQIGDMHDDQRRIPQRWEVVRAQTEDE
jgi:hypothetical protein